MVETKTESTEAATNTLTWKSVVDALKSGKIAGISDDARAALEKLPDVAAAMKKPDAKDATEAAPKTPETASAPTPEGRGHRETGAEAHETPHAPAHAPAAPTTLLTPLPAAPVVDNSTKVGAMETPKKVAALSAIGVASGLGSLAASGVELIPAAMQNSPLVHSAVGGLSAVGGSLNGISGALGLGFTGPVAPAVIGAGLGFAGLYAVGKTINVVHRLWNPNAERATGLRPAWLGVKAVTSPVWGTLNALRWGTKKLVGAAPGGVKGAVARGGHELRNAVKWGVPVGIGAAILGLTTGVGEAALVGAALGYGGNLLYRGWRRFINKQPSTLESSTSAGSLQPPDAPLHPPAAAGH